MLDTCASLRPSHAYTPYCTIRVPYSHLAFFAGVSGIACPALPMSLSRPLCDTLPSMSSLSDQMGFNFRGPQRRVWKVRDLVAAVRSHIEREYADAWIEGEISN